MESTSGQESQGRRAGVHVRPALIDWGIIALGVIFVWFFSGSERGTFVHTPDSEFYLSLGAYSDEVTDRAPNDLYYWTKLGILLPARLLTTVFPPLVALDIFHFVLLVVLFASVYWVGRIGFSRPLATVASLFLTLNTVVLGFVGDTYAVGAVLAALAGLYCCTLVWLLRRGAEGWALPVAMGLFMAWLASINPYGALLGAAGVAALLLANAPALLRLKIWRILASFAVMAISAIAGLLALVQLGKLVFPGLDWFGTLFHWVTTSDSATWAESGWTWLATETTLLVPVFSAVVTALVLWCDPRSQLARSAAALAWVVPIAAVAYKLVTNSNVLETSYYNAFLWPAALLGVVLGVASRGRQWPTTGGAVVLLLASPAAWIALGHWNGVLNPTLIGLVCGVALIVVAACLVWPGGADQNVPSSAPVISTSAALIAVLVLGSLFQVLQNGRPAYAESLHPRVEYEQAYRESSVRVTQERDLQVQEWLISETSPDDSILTWAEAPFISAAAMQLWGENTVNGIDGTSLGDPGLAQIRAANPSVVATYTATQALADALTDELRTDWTVEERPCREFTAEGLPNLTVCLNFLEPLPE